MSVELANPKKIPCYALEAQSTRSLHKISFPVMETFSENCMFYNENPEQYKTGYTKINKFSGPGNNQLSLLLIEIFFLCKCVPFGEKSEIIYIGASPGDHITYLAEFFPFLTFHLYDIEKMDKIKDQENIKKIPKLFDDKEALKYKNMSCYLISDMRSLSYGRPGEDNSAIIDKDMYDQLRWCEIIKVKYALLRFRPKHLHDFTRVGREEEWRNYFDYADGYLLRIPFTKKEKSRNAFLITNNFEKTKRYYHQYVISLITHHDLNIRAVNVYDNPLEDDLQRGFFGEKKVKAIVKAIGLQVSNLSESDGNTTSERDNLKYACGVDWDHRVMFHVFSLYCRYTGKSEKFIPELILRPYITMNEAIT